MRYAFPVTSFQSIVLFMSYLAFLGFGFNFLLTALFPPWRGKDRAKWKLFNLVNFLPAFLDSFLGQLGFAKLGLVKRGPATTRDFEERSAVLLYYVFAAIFLFLGTGGLVLIVYGS